MNNELHEKIEKAAVDITVDIIHRDPKPAYLPAIGEAAVRGAEHGYKEAITQAKEWLMNYFFFEHSLMSASGCDLFLRTFEDAMKKLLEEKK